MLWNYVIKHTSEFLPTAQFLAVFFSYCNKTHTKTTFSTADIVQKKLPNLFPNHLVGAGSDIGIQGSCEGDSGGPLMIINRESQQCRLEVISVHSRLSHLDLYLVKSVLNTYRAPSCNGSRRSPWVRWPRFPWNFCQTWWHKYSVLHLVCDKHEWSAR